MNELIKKLSSHKCTKTVSNKKQNQTKPEKKLFPELDPLNGCLWLSSIHFVKSILGMMPELQGTRGLIL